MKDSDFYLMAEKYAQLYSEQEAQFGQGDLPQAGSGAAPAQTPVEVPKAPSLPLATIAPSIADAIVAILESFAAGDPAKLRLIWTRVRPAVLDKMAKKIAAGPGTPHSAAEVAGDQARAQLQRDKNVGPQPGSVPQ